MNYEVGNTIGDYEIIGVLGAGGMGKVYKVRNTISDRVEAMKVLLPNLDDDPELAERFMREIKVQASLDHPNIAALHTAQRMDKQFLMIMEYVDGTTLESIMRKGRIPLHNAIDYISQVLSALAYAHKRGIVHRDIKPSNMMLTSSGAIKLMDFGIAKMAADRRLTQTGRTVGSLFYMSPEQIRGDTQIDGRADLYSLGIALYEMVTGKRPFNAESDFSIMAAHLQQSPIPPVQLEPGLPAAMNELVLVSIAKDPGQRFQTADAFRNALQAVPTGVAVSPGGTSLVMPHPQAAAPAPMPMPPPPQQPQVAPQAMGGSSRRGLYMVLGSLVTVAILALAAVEIPKWRQAGAAGSPQIPQENSQTQTPVQKPVEQPAQQQPAQQTAVAPVETPQNPPAAVPLPMPNEQKPAVERPRQQRAAAAPATPQEQVTNQAAPPVQQPQQQQPAAPNEQQQADGGRRGGARQAELEELQHRHDQMSDRASAILPSLQRLESQQAASGLGLSPELATARQKLVRNMDQADAAIKEGKPMIAARHLEEAERALLRLEERFGR